MFANEPNIPDKEQVEIGNDTRGYDYIQNERLNNEFKNESDTIGTGSFGVVTKAMHRLDGKEYAIKKIVIRGKDDFERKIQELKMWSQINNDYFVQYRSAWIGKPDLKTQEVLITAIMKEQNISVTAQSLAEFKMAKKITDFKLLHIQMDLCSFSLRQAMSKMKDFFLLKTNELMPNIAYYISSEIFIEILKAINFLHNMKPPVIHRDIKPENILIKHHSNAKFIKVGDFGMAAFHEYPDLSHTQMRGTVRYMAPEVMISRRYDTKADIYSTGVMIQELFNFDINLRPEGLSKKYTKIMDLAVMAMNGQSKERPLCSQFLNTRTDWSLSYKDVRDDIIKTIDLKKANHCIDNEFSQTFLRAKYDVNNK